MTIDTGIPRDWRLPGASVAIDAWSATATRGRLAQALLLVAVVAAADGTPLAGVHLSAASGASAHTDAAGQAVVAVPAGAWSLRTRCDGWGDVVRTGTAAAGASVAVDLALYPGAPLLLADYVLRADADLPIAADAHALWDPYARTGLRVLAKALRYAREPDPPVAWKAEITQALIDVMGTEIDPATGLRTSSGALGQNLLAYVLAAEQVELGPPLSTSWAAWLRAQLTTTNSDGRSLVTANERQATSIGLYAGATLLAAYRWLGDDAGVAHVAAVYRGWLGEREVYAGHDYDPAELAWQGDPAAPRGVNAAGATITWDGTTYDVDGVLPEGMRRYEGGPAFVYPWPSTTFAFTDLQGATTQAWLLSEMGYADVWSWGDEALRRAYRWLYEVAGVPATGDDTAPLIWINAAYGTDYAVPQVTRAMKHVGYVEILTHQPALWYQVADVARLLRDGIWMDRAAAAELSQTSLAWWELLRWADKTPVVACWDQNNQADSIFQAAAMVWLATGDAAYRDKAIAGCLAAIGTEIVPSTGQRASSLALGRNLGGYVIAADLAGLPTWASAEDAARFRLWVREMIHTLNSDGRDLVLCGRVRANNWGTSANVSLLAAYAYLGDAAAFQAAAALCHSLMGARWLYTGWEWRVDMTWHADPEVPVGINPLGSVTAWDNPYLPALLGQTYSVDGAIPEEMRRWDGVSYIAPPPSEGYAWEGLQGYVAQAHILSRAGYPAWEWEDQAIRRAVDWLHREPVNYNNFIWLGAAQPVTAYTNYDLATARGASVVVRLRIPGGAEIDETLVLHATDTTTPVQGVQTCLAVLAVTVPIDIPDGYSLKIYGGSMECGIVEGEAGIYPYAVGYPAEGDDRWQIYLVNAAYGSDYPTATPTTPGKTVGFTDWTHPAGPEVFEAVAALQLRGPLALYDADAAGSLWQDVAGTAPVTAAGQPVARIDDLSGAGRHAIQSDPAKRPVYQVVGGHGVLVPDRVNDALVMTIPTGGWSGSLLLATPGGTLAYGVSVPAGAYNILTADGLYLPGTQWCGAALRVPGLHAWETAALRGWYQVRGAGALYAGVTAVTNYWRGRTELRSFPAEAAAATWQALGSAWRGCTGLTVFPALALAAVTGASNAWRDCAALTDFPGASLAGAPATDWTSAWQGCALTQASVDSILLALAANGHANGVLGLQSGANATPSATGKTAADQLRARGWTVSLNGY